MWQVQRPRVLLPWRFWTFWLAISRIVAVILLACDGPIGFTPVLGAQTSNPSTTPREFVPAIPFRYLNRFPPYPDDALRLGEEGTVRVRISITDDGRVSQVSVLHSSGSLQLDRTTAFWIQQRWRYHPATLNGKPVASTLDINVTFSIKR